MGQTQFTMAKKHGDRNLAQIMNTSNEQKNKSPHFNAMPVKIRGTIYQSHREAAEALGVCDNAISQMLRRLGHAETVGLGLGGGPKGNKNGSKKLVLGNFTFVSRTKAAEELGITRSQLTKWISPKASEGQRQMLLSALMRYQMKCAKE